MTYRLENVHNNSWHRIMRNKLSQTLGLFWLFIFFIQAVSQNADAQSSSNSDIDNRLKRLELEIKDLHIHLFQNKDQIVFQKKLQGTTKKTQIL